MVSPSLVRLPRNVHFLQILFVEYYFHATLYCSEYKDNKLSTIIHYKSGKIVSKRTKPPAVTPPEAILLSHFSITADTTLYFGYFPFRAELFPPDGLLFLQGRQCSGEFVLPA